VIDKSDLNLMQKYLAGDEEAFQLIYKKYSGKVFSYLLKRTKNQELAEDIFQRVWLKFHRSRSAFKETFPLLQWIYVISRSTLIDFYRSKKNSGEHISLDQAFLKDLSSKTDDEILKNENLTREQVRLHWLHTLSRDQIEIFEMHFFDELSYEEMAYELSKSQASLRKIISRSLSKLRGIG